MKAPHQFCSALAVVIVDYMTHMRSIGRGFVSEEHMLRQLDVHFSRHGQDLNSDTFASWCLADDHMASGVRRNRMRIVRNMCLYRQRTHPDCFVPDRSLFPANHQPVQPHIFTETEIVTLLHVTESLRPSSNSPLHRQVYRLALVLLYTTGLRRNELVRLTIGDYEHGEHTLLVRESKFHKSRLLPLSLDASRELDAYLSTRRAFRLPMSAETPLLWNRNGGANDYTGSCIQFGIAHLFRTANIRTAAGRLPRVHDFRHTFAVHALMRWYRRGENVQVKLPFLSAYMGHVSVVSTEYYLHFIDELAACASERFARHCAELVTSLTVLPGGGQ